jgi:hypothetical protein
LPQTPDCRASKLEMPDISHHIFILSGALQLPVLVEGSNQNFDAVFAEEKDAVEVVNYSGFAVKLEKLCHDSAHVKLIMIC